MNIGERVAIIETELKVIRKLLYLIIGGVGVQAGSNIFPLVTATLLQ